MQAVILAAGEGTRMRPLTYTKPKHLLRIAGKPILQHNLEQIKKSGLIDEIILIIGYKGEQIKNYFGDEFQGIKVKYVVQGKLLGTGHALLQAKDFIKTGEKFLVMYGDDLYHANDIKMCLEHELCVSAKEVDNPERFGVFVIENDNVKDLIEKPKEVISNLANTGLYVLNTNVFKLLENLKESARKEFELTDIIKEISAKERVYCEISKHWIPIGYPWDMLVTNEIKLEEELEGGGELVDESSVIENNVTIKGKVKIGRNTVVKNGTYIEGNCMIGSECEIGPNCYLRENVVIGNNCRVGNGVEIKNSIVGDHTKIPHLSYIGDSIIGDNCNLGAGTTVANLRHDNKSVKVLIKGESVDSGRRKFGVIIADYSKTGINTSLYPGVIMGPCSWTTPNSIVDRGIEPFHLFDGIKKLIKKEKLDTAIKDSEDLEEMKILFEKLKDIKY